MPSFWLKVKVYILFVVHVNIHVLMAINLFECVGQISQDYITKYSESLLNEILLFIFEYYTYTIYFAYISS